MKRDTGESMCGGFGAGDDKGFDFVMQAAECFLGVRELVCMVNFVTDGWIGFGFISGTGVGNALSQIFAMLRVLSWLIGILMRSKEAS